MRMRTTAVGVAASRDRNTDKSEANVQEDDMVSMRDDIAKAFGKVLRQQRMGKGLSQEELAARCKVEKSYPSLLERGLRSPTVTMLVQLAQGLSISATDLLALTLQELPVLGEPKKAFQTRSNRTTGK